MTDEKAILAYLDRVAAALERMAPRAAAAFDFAEAEAFVWQIESTGLSTRAARQSPAPRVAQRYRSRLGTAPRQYAPLCAGLACQQRAALGRAGHGQVVARQGGPRPGAPGTRARQGRQAGPEAGRDPPRGHRRPARMPLPPARRQASLHRLLRRPLLRQGRHLLQVVEGRARGRHRRAARQRRVLRHLQPPPPDAARHDGERALDRDQSVRGGGREGFAVRPLRACGSASTTPPRTSSSKW